MLMAAQRKPEDLPSTEATITLVTGTKLNVRVINLTPRSLAMYTGARKTVEIPPSGAVLQLAPIEAVHAEYHMVFDDAQVPIVPEPQQRPDYESAGLHPDFFSLCGTDYAVITFPPVADFLDAFGIDSAMVLNADADLGAVRNERGAIVGSRHFNARNLPIAFTGERRLTPPSPGGVASQNLATIVTMADAAGRSSLVEVTVMTPHDINLAAGGQPVSHLKKSNNVLRARTKFDPRKLGTISFGDEEFEVTEFPRYNEIDWAKSGLEPSFLWGKVVIVSQITAEILRASGYIKSCGLEGSCPIVLVPDSNPSTVVPMPGSMAVPRLFIYHDRRR